VSTLLAILGLSLVSVSWLHYLWLIPQERVPARPIIHTALMTAGLIFSVGAPWVDASLLSAGLGVVTAPLAFLFFYLLTQARLPDTEIAVTVGDELLGFTATDPSGVAVGPAEWRGERVLLKFFRGGW